MTSNPKKEGHFRGQGIKFERKMAKYENGFFFKNATLKFLDGTTSYTLHQPWDQSTLQLSRLLSLLRNCSQSHTTCTSLASGSGVRVSVLSHSPRRAVGQAGLAAGAGGWSLEQPAHVRRPGPGARRTSRADDLCPLHRRSRMLAASQAVLPRSLHSLNNAHPVFTMN